MEPSRLSPPAPLESRSSSGNIRGFAVSAAHEIQRKETKKEKPVEEDDWAADHRMARVIAVMPRDEEYEFRDDGTESWSGDELFGPTPIGEWRASPFLPSLLTPLLQMHWNENKHQ